MTLRPIPHDQAAPLIACIQAVGEVQDRLRANAPPKPIKPRPHPEPSRRRNNPGRDYGLLPWEIAEWRWLMERKRLTTLEAANVVIRSRRPEGGAA